MDSTCIDHGQKWALKFIVSFVTALGMRWLAGSFRTLRIKLIVTVVSEEGILTSINIRNNTSRGTWLERCGVVWSRISQCIDSYIAIYRLLVLPETSVVFNWQGWITDLGRDMRSCK